MINFFSGDELEGKSKANLRDILKFITGLRDVPPLGFPKPITLIFTSDERKALLEAAACFYVVTLPLCHTAKEVFFSPL